MAAAVASCSQRAASLASACRNLWSQQATDGGFHSSTYGLLRSGQSLTPFVLDALLDVPENVTSRPPGAVDRAISFITRNTTSDGTLGRIDDTAADYPNYATALAVSVLLKAKRADAYKDVATMVAQLRSQQFTETNGWKREDAPYGGWGMGGPIHHPPEAGHVDLSMTRHVLEALKSAGTPSSDPAMTRALVYLERSQNPDGGFYFSTVNPEINKAGESGEGFASYGTTTADGVLALRAAGLPESGQPHPKSDPMASSAHHRIDHAPGFEGSARQSWGLGLRFYYAAVISRAVPELPVQLFTLPRRTTSST